MEADPAAGILPLYFILHTSYSKCSNYIGSKSTYFTFFLVFLVIEADPTAGILPLCFNLHTSYFILKVFKTIGSKINTSHLFPSLPAHRGRSCSLYSSIVLHSSYFILFTQSVQTIGSKINISRLFSCLPSHRGRSCSWNSSYATRLQSEKYRGILPGNLRLETVSHPFVTIYALSIIEIATKLEVGHLSQET